MELMRGLAFIALLFAGSAVGAELRQAEVCGDGTTHQAGYCPAVLSSASCSATGATTGSCSATSDEADGTRYVCATSNNTALTGAEIEACSGGAAIAGSSAAETGSNSVSLSGLTTDAAHYGQIVNESPEGWYSNRLVSSSFTPTSTSDPYDLYATDSSSRGTIPFAVNWPIEPTLSTTVNVTNASSFNTALSTANATINVSAGSYGVISPSVSDQHWILADGATVSGLQIASSGVDRITIEGGEIAAGSSNIEIYGDDVMLKNVNISSVRAVLLGLNAFGGNPRINISRTAFVRVTCVAQRYCAFSPGQENGTDYNTDLIVAGSLLYGGQSPSGVEATMRIMGTNRVIAVDNRSKNGVEGSAVKHNWRSHYGSRNYWMRRNLVEYGDGIYFEPSSGEALVSGDEMGPHWVYDHLHYRPSSNPNAISSSSTRIATSGYFAAGNLVAVDNTSYDSRTTGSCVANTRWFWNGQSGDTISGQWECEYEAPPALGSWLTAGGLQPGADH